jgi:hypothetical protein
MLFQILMFRTVFIIRRSVALSRWDNRGFDRKRTFNFNFFLATTSEDTLSCAYGQHEF